MLYEVSWSAQNFLTIVIVLAVSAFLVLAPIYLRISDSRSGRNRRDKSRSNSRSGRNRQDVLNPKIEFFKSDLYLLLSIIQACCVIFGVTQSISKKAMILDAYRSGKYETVSGEVSNYRLIYSEQRKSSANSKNKPICARFSVSGVEFSVDNDFLDESYQLNDNIIIGDRQKITIYYLPSVSGPVRDILRIDKG